MYARGAFEATQTLVLATDDSDGVVVGADLTFSGFPIGRVQRIELAPDGRARVIIDVPKKDAHWLRTSSHLHAGARHRRRRQAARLQRHPDRPAAARRRHARPAGGRHGGGNPAPAGRRQGPAEQPGQPDGHRFRARRHHAQCAGRDRQAQRPGRRHGPADGRRQAVEPADRARQRPAGHGRPAGAPHRWPGGQCRHARVWRARA